jgi:hypothetical protein
MKFAKNLATALVFIGIISIGFHICLLIQGMLELIAVNGIVLSFFVVFLSALLRGMLEDEGF